MITVRKAAERGHGDHGWLKTWHSFSFADYFEPKHMGFQSLRVINEDFVAPGMGFGMHPHRDMEIITYILEGELEHKDSMGNGSVLRAGEFQRMSAGTGVEHSEFNPSSSKRVHLYQIWIRPNRKGVTPSYEQKQFPAEEKTGALRLVASPDGALGSLRIEQDARVYLGSLRADDRLQHPLGQGRHAWVQVLRGQPEVNGQLAHVGDGVALSGEPELSLQAAGDAEVMVFDLA